MLGVLGLMGWCCGPRNLLGECIYTKDPNHGWRKDEDGWASRKMVRLLWNYIRKGQLEAQKDGNGSTILHSAIMNRDPLLLQMLIKRISDPIGYKILSCLAFDSEEKEDIDTNLPFHILVIRT